jgi:hypothetical protein
MPDVAGTARQPQAHVTADSLRKFAIVSDSDMCGLVGGVRICERSSRAE